jgi:hypothetical protein
MSEENLLNQGKNSRFDFLNSAAIKAAALSMVGLNVLRPFISSSASCFYYAGGFCYASIMLSIDCANEKSAANQQHLD